MKRHNFVYIFLVLRLASNVPDDKKSNLKFSISFTKEMSEQSTGRKAAPDAL